MYIYIYIYIYAIATGQIIGLIIGSDANKIFSSRARPKLFTSTPRPRL